MYQADYLLVCEKEEGESTMSKVKKFKFLLMAMIFALMISVLNSSLRLFAASELSADFKQLNYTQLLAEMGTGWNLGNTLEANINGTPTETGWGNPETTKEFIAKVKAEGFNSIRIPVSYLSKVGSAPDYTVEAAWMKRIKEVVDYAISEDMYVMINMHGDGYKTVVGSWLIVDAEDQEPIREKYQKIWEQVANTFKDYDEHLIFESMNEEFDGDWDNPKREDYANLNVYNQIFVDTIRKTGGNNSARWLLIPGWNTNIDHTVGDFGFEIPKDTYRSSTIPASEQRIAISVHYYSPWEFCGAETGATTQWGETAIDPDKCASWGQEDYMESQFYGMYTKFVSKGYPFIVGEYGSIDKTVSDPNSNKYRQIFAKTLCKTIKKYGGVPVYWDNGYNGDMGFALFERKTCTVSQQGIIDAIMAADKETPAFNPSVVPVLVVPTPVPSGSFSVDYDCGESSTISVTIKNNLTNKNINGWTMEFSFPGDQKITNMWGGTYTQEGQKVTIKSADYTSSISAKGGIVTFGFTVNYTGTNEKPANFIINGSSTSKDISVVTPTSKPATPTPATPTGEYSDLVKIILGDVNGDGTFNAIDFAEVRKYLLGISEPTYIEWESAADVNGDNSVNAIDFALMRSELLGLDVKFHR